MEDGDQELVDCIWAYINQQVTDISEDDIPIVLSSLPPTHKFLLPLFGKPFHKTWWKLNSTEIVMCLDNLVKLNTLQVSIMRDIGSWLFLNIHEVKEQEVSQCIRAFHHFNFYDGNLMSALERYIPAKNKQLHAELPAVVAEYCRSRRYFSPAILDAIAVHFCAKGENYQSSEVFLALRVFGQLNYLPQDGLPRFLLQAEKMIEKHFDNLDFGQMCELVCSFAFVEKISLSIVQKVFSYTFLSRIKSSPQGHKAGMWLEMLQTAVRLDVKGFRLPYLFKLHTKQMLKDTRLYILQNQLKGCLEELLGTGMVKIRPFADRSIYILDAEIIVTAKGVPIPVSSEDEHLFRSEDKRVAILITTADDVCLNTNHMLGKFSMRQRHLKKMGYTVIEVPDKEFLPLNRLKQNRYLKKKLEAVIDFMKLSI
ncbi:FAST kinase domain-containing protein 3, mitochondrial-like [Pomacea canaliculata]|uniref:FAST kinase domain-containing protein 3, mitochondrial-like n=1 Tax=Pomacea canaliculata TaxID=400727 RepID=UPI000D73B856|nr:FAST kinase domain-containing protein 3, mitochondrial-like [Pomacea canaliculata]